MPSTIRPTCTAIRAASTFVDRALGALFTVNSPIFVTQLGTFDNPANGSGTFGGTISVAIYSVTLSGNNITGGSLVVSPVSFLTGSAGTLLSGTDTRLKDIADVQLVSGTYMVVANHYGTAAGTEMPWNMYYEVTSPIIPGGGPPYASANTGGGLLGWPNGDYYMNSPASWGSSLPAGWTFVSDAYTPRWTGGNFDFVPVPEAGAFAMAGVGLLGFVYVGRCAWLRRKTATA